MAFKTAFMHTGEIPAALHMIIKSGQTYEVGTLLKCGTTGPLEVIGATDSPEFLLLESVEATTAGQQVLVQPVVHTAVYETTSTAAISAGVGKTFQTVGGTQISATEATPGTKVGSSAYGATLISPTSVPIGGKCLVQFMSNAKIREATA